MLHVTVTQFHPDDPPEVLAEMSVDEKGVRHLSGQRGSEVLATTVTDPASGARVFRGDDPISWAKFLPHALLGSGQVARVQEA